MFSVENYNRYNERIFVVDQSVDGTPVTGAISDLITNNLTPNRVLISSSGGKIIESNRTVLQLNTLEGIDESQTIQDQLDGKADSYTSGNFTEATSSVLTITGGTGAVLGTGLSVQVKQASGSQAGYLSAADWITFNSKPSATLASGKILVGNASNVATAVDMSGDAVISNTGVVTINATTIINDYISNVAGIEYTKLQALNPNIVPVTNGSGFITNSTTTTTALGRINNLSSDAQTQLDSKLTVALSTIAAGDLIQFDGTDWYNVPIGSSGYVWTSDGTIGGWQAGTSNGLPTGGSTGQYLNKINGTNYNAQWSTLNVDAITDLTSSATELNQFTGVTTTQVQYQFLNSITSNVQTQLGNKQSSALGYNAIWVGNISGLAAQLPAGSEGQALIITSGSPSWQTIAGTGTVTSIDVDGGTTGLTTSGGPVTTTGAITLDGILIGANGGTGVANTGKTITVSGNTTIGSSTHTVAFVTSANSSVTLPTTGTLATRAGTETLTNKTLGSGTKILIGSDATGDIYYNGGSGTVIRLAATTDGYVLTLSSGVPIWSAGGGAGIGGSTGSTDNALLRADGTGGSTVQSSSIVLSDTADLTLGVSGLAGSARSISATGSATDVGITLTPKGAGRIVLINWELNGNIWEAPSGSEIRNSGADSFTIEAGALNLQGWSGGAGSGDGGDVIVLGGDGGTTGDNDGGTVTIRSGVAGNSGTPGDVIIDPLTGFLDLKLTASPELSPLPDTLIRVKISGVEYDLVAQAV